MFSSQKITQVFTAGAVIATVAVAGNSSAFAVIADQVKATTDVNIRSGPGNAYEVLSVLPKNAVAEKVGTSGNWVKVEYKNTTGYVYKSYLSSITSTSEDSKVETASQTKTVYVTASALNVRSGPSTSYSVVGSLKNGASVTTYGSTNGWYKIKYNNKTAYISAEYTSTKAPSGSSSGSSNSSDSSSSSSESVNYNVKVTASALNVRSGAGTGYSVKGVLYQGDVVKATNLTNGWYKISFNGSTGYISAQYATKTSASVSTGSGSTSSGSSGSSSSSTSNGSSLSASERSEIVALAKTKLGCSYVYGAEGPNTFDCSGFTQWLYKQFGVSIPRSSSAQWSGCNKISKSSLQPGDLVFFSNSSSGGSVGHVAMYIGNDTIIHAANSTSGVITSSLSSNYYTTHYIGSGRY